jgi:hypothetical protein
MIILSYQRQRQFERLHKEWAKFTRTFNANPWVNESFANLSGAQERALWLLKNDPAILSIVLGRDLGTWLHEQEIDSWAARHGFVKTSPKYEPGRWAYNRSTCAKSCASDKPHDAKTVAAKEWNLFVVGFWLLMLALLIFTVIRINNMSPRERREWYQNMDRLEDEMDMRR